MTISRQTTGVKLLGAPKIQDFLKRFGKGGFERLETNVTLVLLVVGCAYLLATIASGIAMTTMMSQIIASRARISSRLANEMVSADSMSGTMTNTRDIAKTIKDRNLFNSDGKFPDEKFGGNSKAMAGVFDIEAPCRPTTLPIELLGTIFLGDRFKSIATVRDKTYSEADIYRPGDEIYGSEGATVAAVDRQTLIINNLGVKECIELNQADQAIVSDGFPKSPGGDFTDPQSGGGSTGGEYTLESSYVESELGPGAAKIMVDTRFVPNTVNNGINGFKLFGIKGGSLLTKIGLQNNDVVTQVNDTSLTQPDSGYAFFQALQDEKTVRLRILRGGITPTNITVIIK